jgi:hypothetical protein
MRRILEIGIYKPGGLRYEVIGLDDVNAYVGGGTGLCSQSM